MKKVDQLNQWPKLVLFTNTEVVVRMTIFDLKGELRIVSFPDKDTHQLALTWTSLRLVGWTNIPQVRLSGGSWYEFSQSVAVADKMLGYEGKKSAERVHCDTFSRDEHYSLEAFQESSSSKGTIV